MYSLITISGLNGLGRSNKTKRVILMSLSPSSPAFFSSALCVSASGLPLFPMSCISGCRADSTTLVTIKRYTARHHFRRSGVYLGCSMDLNKTLVHLENRSTDYGLEIQILHLCSVFRI